MNETGIGSDKRAEVKAAVTTTSEEVRTGRHHAGPARLPRHAVGTYEMVAPPPPRPLQPEERVDGPSLRPRVERRSNIRDRRRSPHPSSSVYASASAEIEALAKECQRLRERLAEAHEQERRRLARDLHDHTGQSIVGIMMQLSAIESGIGDEEARRQLQELRGTVQSVGDELHHLAVSLRDTANADCPPSVAIDDLVSEWTSRTGIEVTADFDRERVDDLPAEIGGVIYRVVQESLTNVAKHAASATAVSVRVAFARRTVRVSIQDDGPGFLLDDGQRPLEAGEARGRIGLVGMRERLAEVAGHLRIVSEPGRGTIVAAVIPLWNPARLDVIE